MEEDNSQGSDSTEEDLVPLLHEEVNASAAEPGGEEAGEVDTPSPATPAEEQLESAMAEDGADTEQEKEAELVAAQAAAAELSTAQPDNPDLVRRLLKAKTDLDEFRNARIQRQIGLLIKGAAKPGQIKKYVPVEPDLSSKIRRMKKKKEPAQPLNEQQDEVEHIASNDKRKKPTRHRGPVTRSTVSSGDFSQLEFSDDSDQEEAGVVFDSGVRIPAPVPVIKDGDTYKEFEERVEIWVATVQGRIPKQQQALLLLSELPNTEKSGSLRTRIKDKVGMRRLQATNGVAYLMAAIRHIKDAPNFVRLVTWMRAFMTFKQKSNWSNDHFLAEQHKLLKTGEEEFDFVLPVIFKAAMTLTTCTDISVDNLNIITQDIDLGHKQVDRLVERAMKKFITSRHALGGSKQQPGKSTGTYYTGYGTDLAGNPIGQPEGADQGGGDDGGAKPFHVKVSDIMAKPPGKRTGNDWKLLRENARKTGNCTTCFKAGHKAEACPDREREEKRVQRMIQRVIAGGGVWDNKDGTFVVGPPPGSTVTEDPRKALNKSQFSASLPAPAQQQPLPGLTVLRHGEPVSYNQEELTFDPNNLSESYTSSVVTQVPRVIYSAADAPNPRGVVDSGCARTNAGTSWLNNFYNSMRQEDKELVRTYDSGARFKYGDSAVYTSLRLWTFPVYLGGARRIMAADEVAADIPLLISLAAMKRLGMQLNLEHDSATIKGAPRRRRNTSWAATCCHLSNSLSSSRTRPTCWRTRCRRRA